MARSRAAKRGRAASGSQSPSPPRTTRRTTSCSCSEPEQLRALGDDLRSRIIALLRDRAASTTELAAKLGLPKGTVGHHVKVLEKAGLVHVVRTRQVRAVTEKYYGRTARLFLFKSADSDGADVRNVAAAALRRVAEEMLPLREDEPTTFGAVTARLADADARRLTRRLKKLMDDFRAADSRRRRGVRPRGRALPAGARCVGCAARPAGSGVTRDFLKLWTGQTISEFGSQVSALAIPWVALVTLKSTAFEVATLGTVEFLPFVLFTLPAGVWVDWVSRRRVLIAGDVGPRRPARDHPADVRARRPSRSGSSTSSGSSSGSTRSSSTSPTSRTCRR